MDFDITDYQEWETVSPMAFAASADPDTMYLHEAMKQPDKKQFVEAMEKEIQDHSKRKHWELVHRSTIPKGTTVLPGVWSMKRKRDIKTREIKKWKARLNIHGGKQVKGETYWDTFAPVVTWISIRLILILSLIHGWHTRQSYSSSES